MNLQNEFVHHSGTCEFCPATANCGGFASFELGQKPRCIKGCCFGEIRFREFPLPLHFRCIRMYTYTKMYKIFAKFSKLKCAKYVLKCIRVFAIIVLGWYSLAVSILRKPQAAPFGNLHLLTDSKVASTAAKSANNAGETLAHLMLGFFKLDFTRFPEDPFKNFGRCKQPGKGGMIDKVRLLSLSCFFPKGFAWRYSTGSLPNIPRE